MNETEARSALRALRAAPYGVTRNANAEQLTRRIEAEGPASCLAEALLDLVEGYVFSDEGHKAIAAIARALRLWDERPDLFDAADRRNLFMELRWVAGDLADWLEVPTAQAAAVFDDMQRRYRHAGHGLSGVFSTRFRYAFHTGDPAADEAMSTWLATPRDPFSQCEACEPGERADYLCERGILDGIAYKARNDDFYQDYLAGRRYPLDMLHQLA